MQGDAALDPGAVVRVVVEGPGHRRDEVSGRYAVDLDVVGTQFDGHGFGKLDHSALGGAVDAGLGEADVAAQGAYIDDLAAALFFHDPGNLLTDKEDTLQVDRGDEVVVLFRDFCVGFDVLNAGVVDQDIDPTVGVQNLLRHVPDAVLFCHIHPEGAGFEALGADVCRRLLHLFKLDVRTGDLTSGFCKNVSIALAETGSRSSHQNDLAGDIKQILPIQNVHKRNPFVCQTHL